MIKKFLLLLALAPLSAHAILLGGLDIGTSNVDFTYFKIDNTANVHITTANSAFDPVAYVFTDDGTSSFGNLEGVNDGTVATGFYEVDFSFSELNMPANTLAAGTYVIAIGPYELTEAEARGGLALPQLANTSYDLTIEATLPRLEAGQLNLQVSTDTSFFGAGGDTGDTGPGGGDTGDTGNPGGQIPEPGTLALLGLGLAGIGAARRRKNV